MANRCAGCTLCCKLTEVKTFDKPCGTLCPKAHPGRGCSIHGSHPQECSGYECAYYAMPSLPEGLRPDVCGVLFERVRGSRILLALVDPDRPLAASSPDVSKLIHEFVRGNIPVVVVRGQGTYPMMHLPPNWTPADVMSTIRRSIQNRGGE